MTSRASDSRAAFRPVSPAAQDDVHEVGQGAGDAPARPADRAGAVELDMRGAPLRDAMAAGPDARLPPLPLAARLRLACTPSPIAASVGEGLSGSLLLLSGYLLHVGTGMRNLDGSGEAGAGGPLDAVAPGVADVVPEIFGFTLALAGALLLLDSMRRSLQLEHDQGQPQRDDELREAGQRALLDMPAVRFHVPPSRAARTGTAGVPASGDSRTVPAANPSRAPGPGA